MKTKRFPPKPLFLGVVSCRSKLHSMLIFVKVLPSEFVVEVLMFWVKKKKNLKFQTDGVLCDFFCCQFVDHHEGSLLKFWIPSMTLSLVWYNKQVSLVSAISNQNNVFVGFDQVPKAGMVHHSCVVVVTTPKIDPPNLSVEPTNNLGWYKESFKKISFNIRLRMEKPIEAYPWLW